MWILPAFLSAILTALSSILDKMGLSGVSSNLATAIRTSVVVVMAWGIVLLSRGQGEVASISRRSWVFLVLSGVATGLSWLLYYKSLQMADASKVIPVAKMSVVITLVLAFIFLREPFTWKAGLGAALITAGTLIMVL